MKIVLKAFAYFVTSVGYLLVGLLLLLMVGSIGVGIYESWDGISKLLLGVAEVIGGLFILVAMVGIFVWAENYIEKN
jgi:hypothetical protein